MKIIYLLPLLSFLACSAPNEEKAKVLEVDKIALYSDIDPICEMSVKEHIADTAVYEGKIYGFCNVSCKKEFKSNPEQYLK